MSALLLAVPLLIGAPALKDGRKSAEQPLGEWAIERLEFNGRLIETKPDDRMSISADAFALLRLGKFQSSSEPAAFFKADRGKAEVDFYPDDPKKLRRGIWKIEGDTLTICDAGRGVDRPIEFAAPEGSKCSLWVLKRVPKK
jgi:uncharacterized protein (TIGR03067 family)